MTTESLLPCPFCGQKTILNSSRIGFPVATACGQCRAEGPLKLTGIEADEAWNIRAESDEIKRLREVNVRLSKALRAIVDLAPQYRSPYEDSVVFTAKSALENAKG